MKLLLELNKSLMEQMAPEFFQCPGMIIIVMGNLTQLAILADPMMVALCLVLVWPKYGAALMMFGLIFGIGR
jgi:hypothetical protein